MKKLINKDRIATLNPCKNRFDNYLKFYADKSFTKGQFMGLKNITQEDKLWVAFRLIPIDNIHLAAADIAESVLHLFESKYPNDKRPRLAIEAARNNNKDAAYAAANAAYAADKAARNNNKDAANAAAKAAAYAANAAAYTANAAANAAYAAAVYAANAAAYNAISTAYTADADAYNAISTDYTAYDCQQKLIRKIVLKYWR